MTSMNPGDSRYTACSCRGFVLAEALATIGLLVVLVALLAVATSDTRRRSQLAGTVGNLRQIGAGHAAFASDNDNKVCTFQSATLEAAQVEAVEILRRLSGRPNLPPITSWVPHILYSHLVLQDYLGQPIPSKLFTSPGDTTRLAWQRDPLNIDNLPNRPLGGSPSTNYRWPYSSSYELGPAFYAPDRSVGQQQTISQSTGHNLYIVPPGVVFGNRRFSEVSFPANKAFMWESHQRFFGPRQPYFGLPEARVPMLMADLSVGVRCTQDSNRGFQPNSPQSLSPTIYTYQPDTGWEPPVMANPPGSGDVVQGVYRWTRAGLPGRDFGGPEVPAQ